MNVFTRLILSVLTAIAVNAMLLPYVCHAQTASAGIKKIVIDAGHGGQDPGTVSRGMREKDITLSVALKLGALVNEHYPNVEVIYTRKTDVFIELNERGDIANRAGADLFISIHINGVKSSSASGSETLVMGADKAGKNLDIAMRENDVIVYEKDYTVKYQGYTPGSAESFIIFSLMQYSNQSQSYTLAEMVQKQFTRNTKMIDRGVKQAPVLVLWRAAMPSILTEFGFISHPTEGLYIGSTKGQEMYARCIFNAFSEYKTRADGRGNIITLGQTSPLPEEQPTQRIEAPAEPVDKSAAVYRIQIMSSPTKVAKNSSSFGPYRGEITEIVINKQYKYYTKEAASHKEALSLQAEVRKHIKGAFIVAFSEDTPISIDEAKKINNEK